MKVLWTRFALEELRKIYDYYRVNVSQNVADKIRYSLLQSTNQLAIYPYSGVIENLLIDLKLEHRYILRGNYKIVYRVQIDRVFITDVFDTRQDPAKLYRNTAIKVTINEPEKSKYSQKPLSY